jgi:AmpD protein
MTGEFEAGWWREATRRSSPHCDARPAGCTPDLLVIHAISLPPGEFGGPYVHALFGDTLNCDAHPYFAGLRGLRVSAHFFVDREGAVSQYVPVTARAWHAGVSAFGGVSACNDRSIGIELEGCDDLPFTPAQYVSASRLGVQLMRSFPGISYARVVGHADIAPGRKTDPGPLFDWIGFRAALVAQRCAVMR